MWRIRIIDLIGVALITYPLSGKQQTPSEICCFLITISRSPDKYNLQKDKSKLNLNIYFLSNVLTILEINN